MITPAIERPTPAYISPAFRDDPILNRPIYRYDSGHKRWYCATDTDPVTWAVSVTSLISSTRPTPENLMAWRANLGNDQYRQTLDERAAYGTWMHSLWGDALITGEFSINYADLQAKLRDCPPGLEDAWIEAAQKDLLAFGAWCYERKPTVYAIEPVMIHAQDAWYGGAIDLICSIDWRGKPRTVIIDFKSGRKGFYESHELQLHAYMSIWNSYYAGTDYEVTGVFNLAPTDWRTAPKCNFVDQTDRMSAKLLPNILDMYRADPSCLMEPPTYKKYRGLYKIGENVADAAEEIKPLDAIKQRMGVLNGEV